MTFKSPIVFNPEHIAAFRDYLIGNIYCDWAETNSFPLRVTSGCTEKQLQEAVKQRDKQLERFAKYNADVIIGKLTTWLESNR